MLHHAGLNKDPCNRKARCSGAINFSDFRFEPAAGTNRKSEQELHHVAVSNLVVLADGAHVACALGRVQVAGLDELVR